LPELPPKRSGKGRPAGSKNKPKEEVTEASLRQQTADIMEELQRMKKKQSIAFDTNYKLKEEIDRLKKHVKGGKKAKSVKVVNNTYTTPTQTPPPTAKPNEKEKKEELASLLKFT
jgi:hypothetical protein